MHLYRFHFVALVFLILITLIYRYLWHNWHADWHRARWFPWLRLVYWSFALLSMTPMFFALIYGRNLWPIPIEGALAPFLLMLLAWFYTHLLVTPILFAFFFIRFIVRKTLSAFLFFVNLFSFITAQTNKHKGKSLLRFADNSRLLNSNKSKSPSAIPACRVVEISRRDFLTRITPYAAMGTALSVTGGFIATQAAQIEIKYQKIVSTKKHFPKGLRIMQLSDMHIGHLIHKDYLAGARQRILSAPADILVVTGDIIDNNNYYLPLMQHFFRSIAKHFSLGMYAVLGNHDLIDNGEELAQAMTEANVRMLRNETERLNFKGQSWQLMGLDYPSRWGVSAKRTVMTEKNFYHADRQRDPEEMTILLNHHPAEFPFFAVQKVDLTLAGHTHGGQIVFGDTSLPIGAFFRYNRGLYELNGQQLYVNAGLGHWFPLRISCPAEITVLEIA